MATTSIRNPTDTNTSPQRKQVNTAEQVNTKMTTNGHSEIVNTTDPHRTSRSLIVRASEQDPAAWERIVTLYSPLVYCWCQESGLPPSDLHDVFQDVFYALARNLKKFRPIENGTFRGWLRTLTRNKLNDHFRQAGREPKPVGGTAAQHYLEQIPAAAQHSSTANRSATSFTEVSRNETAIQHSLLCLALSNVRESCSEQTWSAFWMVVVDGRETVDVASDLGMRPGTVRVAKSRVLKRLRLEIGDAIE